jgi:hypothetical protein
MKFNRLTILFAACAILLLIPLIAMQFTEEVNWTVFDFVVMGILLSATSLICELVLRKVKSTTNRIILCIVILLAFFIFWAELAVGIFGSPFAGS